MCLSDRNPISLTRPQDDPLRVFALEVETFLHEFLRLESRADQPGPACPSCEDGVATVRCVDCFGGALFCRNCIVSVHARNPLHRVQVCADYYEQNPLLIAVNLRSGPAPTSAMCR
jgi:hypothetical protein